MDAAVSLSSTPKLFSCRYALVFWGMLGYVALYFQKINLSVAIVAMVNRTAVQPANSSSSFCPYPSDWSTTPSNQKREFDWDGETRSWILGGFFYGYVVTQIPGGLLAARFGGKRVFGLGTLAASLLSLTAPAAARVSWKLLVACRVLQGLAEGVTPPAICALLSKWSPPLERSILATITFGGAQLGTILGLPLASFFCDSSFLGGWPGAFYVNGALGTMWFVAWTIFCFEDPETHPRIEAEERAYILSSLGSRRRIPSTPWRRIFTSAPVWALIITHFAFNWSFYIFFTETPSYLAEVLHFKIAATGFLSALPYLVKWVVIVAGVLMGLSNAAGTIPGFVAPLAVAGLTSTTPTVEGWRSCFFVSAAICGAGAVAFLCLAEGDRLPWATIFEKEEEERLLPKTEVADST